MSCATVLTDIYIYLLTYCGLVNIFQEQIGNRQIQGIGIVPAANYMNGLRGLEPFCVYGILSDSITFEFFLHMMVQNSIEIFRWPFRTKLSEVLLQIITLTLWGRVVIKQMTNLYIYD